MKLIIDIPKDIYKEWKLDGKYRTHSYAQRLILNGTPLKEWLKTFNTYSATECFTAVQQLKETINDRGDTYV